MAVSYVTQYNFSNDGSGDAHFDSDSDLQAGDLLLAAGKLTVNVDDDALTVTLPSGWAHASGSPAANTVSGDGGYASSVFVAYKIADIGDVNTTISGFHQGGGSMLYVGRAAVFRGDFHPTDPISCGYQHFESPGGGSGPANKMNITGTVIIEANSGGNNAWRSLNDGSVTNNIYSTTAGSSTNNRFSYFFGSSMEFDFWFAFGPTYQARAFEGYSIEFVELQNATGTTADKLATGGGTYAYVLAIEGYPYLLTNGTASDVARAWQDTDWTEVQTGLEVSTELEQEITPLQPRIEGGSITCTLLDGPDDYFGQDTFARFKSTGIYTNLTSDLDPTDNQVSGLDISDFPASGTIYIGNENMTYASKSGDDFLSVSRGKYAPFEGNVNSGWAHHHRLALVSATPTFKPIITDWKRVFLGAHVGLWLHKVEDGVLNSKDDALLMFAGVLSDISDNVGSTKIGAIEIKEKIANTTLFENQFSGTLEPGVWVDEHQNFYITAQATAAASTYIDYIYLDASDLGAPARLTVYDIVDAINTKIAAATLQSDAITCGITSDGRLYVTIEWTGTFNHAFISVSCSDDLSNILGLDTAYRRVDDSDNPVDIDLGKAKTAQVTDESNIDITIVGGQAAAYGVPSLSFLSTLDLRDTTGTFVNQADYMPEPIRTNLDTTRGGGFSCGFFKYQDFYFYVTYISDTEFECYWDIEHNIMRLFNQERVYSGIEGKIDFDLVRLDEEPPRVKQVLYWVDSLESFLPALFASTGKAGYNHATHDKYDRQMSLGVPWDLLGDPFLESATYLSDESSPDLSIILEEPTLASEIITPELAIRNAHLTFKEGLRFVKYSGESLNPDHTLSDSDLSAEAYRASEERPVSWWSSDYIVNILKLQYDRSAKGQYQTIVELINSTSLEEYGSHPVTIKARNTKSRGEAGKESIYNVLEDLGGDILATFDEPLMFVRQTVQGSKIFGMAPGDTVDFSSSWIRYYGDGQRGVSNALGVITHVTFDLLNMDGEIELMLTGADLARAASYAPAALVDHDYSTGLFSGGYDATNYILRCETNQFSYPTNTDVQYFTVGDKVRIFERSPATESSPQSWDREITAIDTVNDEITLDSALTGYDTSLQYYITFDTYADCTTAQKAYCFIADDADDYIVDTERSRTYRQLPPGDVYDSAEGSSDTYENPPLDGQWYDEGLPLSPITYTALASNVNHIIGRRTCAEIPGVIQAGEVTPTAWNDTSYVLVYCFYLPIGIFAKDRILVVGPRMSISGGYTGYFKIASSRYLPELASGTVGAGTITTNIKNETSFTTTSATAENVTAQDLQIVDDGVGGTWISIYLKSSNASGDMRLYGFHKLYMEAIDD